MDDPNVHVYVKNNPIDLTDPSGLIASASGNFATTSSTVVLATAPKLDTPAFSMPTVAVNPAAIQGEARDVKMTGNPPETFRLIPNGLDIDYFGGASNLSAQFHESRGEALGHNFFDESHDPAHLPMSPIRRR